MIPARIIEEKRDGRTLEPSALAAFLEGYFRGEVPDYQMAAFCMAAYLRGLDDGEIDVLGGGEAHVAQHAQHEPAAGRHAVDGGDHRPVDRQ